MEDHESFLFAEQLDVNQQTLETSHNVMQVIRIRRSSGAITQPLQIQQLLQQLEEILNWNIQNDESSGLEGVRDECELVGSEASKSLN